MRGRYAPVDRQAVATLLCLRLPLTLPLPPGPARPDGQPILLRSPFACSGLRACPAARPGAHGPCSGHRVWAGRLLQVDAGRPSAQNRVV